MTEQIDRLRQLAVWLGPASIPYLVEPDAPQLPERWGTPTIPDAAINKAADDIGRLEKIENAAQALVAGATDDNAQRVDVALLRGAIGPLSDTDQKGVER